MINIYSPADVAAKIAQMRAWPETKYNRLCIEGWERWLQKLSAGRPGQGWPGPPA